MKYLIFALLLCSCGHKPTKTWPASIQGMSGFTKAQKDEVLSYVKDLNMFMGREIVVLNRENAFTLTFKFVPARELDTTTIGMAHTGDESCAIDLSSELFDDLVSYTETTVWHEIGHCAGLEHIDPSSGEIMSPEALSFSRYGVKELGRFKTDLLRVLGVVK